MPTTILLVDRQCLVILNINILNELKITIKFMEQEETSMWISGFAQEHLMLLVRCDALIETHEKWNHQDLLTDTARDQCSQV